MKPILSVCIPTYNRYSILKESLKGRLDFFKDLNIEICISNNASIDNTKFFIDSLADSYDFVRILHQSHNKGLEQNMIDVMKMADGEYILPIGDDEEIEIIHLNELVEFLKYSPDLLILNGKHGVENHLDMDIIKQKFITPSDAFPFLWSKMPPGSFIVKRDILDNYNYKKYMGTSHAYTGWTWDYLEAKYRKNNNIEIMFFSSPVINFKEEEKTWKNDTFKIMFYEIPKWFDLLSDKYPVIIQNNILKNYLQNMVKLNVLLSYRVNGYLFKEIVNKYSVYFSANQKRNIVLIAYIPEFFAKFILYGSLKTKDTLKWIIRW